MTRIEAIKVEIDLDPLTAAAYARSDGSMRYAVVTQAGELKAASVGVTRALIDPVRPAATPYFSYDDPVTGQAGHGAQVRLPGPAPLFLQVGQGPQHADVIADSLLDELVEHFALAALLGLAAQIFFTTLSIRSTLTPLQRIADATGAGGLSVTRRLPIEHAPRELRPVVGTINRLLAELEDHVAQQRRFTADAAHQLRTPLARLEARLAAAATPEIAAQLRAPVDEMWIAQAASNVLTNAIHHAPRGTAIEIDIPGDGTIAVRDYGPGIAEQDRAHIFERFWRGRSESEAGAGLCLSIVASVMQAHGGSITVEDPPGGGALFRLRFPNPAVWST